MRKFGGFWEDEKIWWILGGLGKKYEKVWWRVLIGGIRWVVGFFGKIWKAGGWNGVKN